MAKVKGTAKISLKRSERDPKRSKLCPHGDGRGVVKRKRASSLRLAQGPTILVTIPNPFCSKGAGYIGGGNMHPRWELMVYRKVPDVFILEGGRGRKPIDNVDLTLSRGGQVFENLQFERQQFICLQGGGAGKRADRRG